MAHEWLYLSLVIIVNFSFVLCNNEYMNCDTCIRAGYKWCNEIGSNHCEADDFDSWCADTKGDGTTGQEMLKSYRAKETPGTFVTLTTLERSINIGKEHKIDITYNKLTKKSGSPKFNVTKVKTTQSYEFEANAEQECQGVKCTITLTVQPLRGFCLGNGTSDEFFHIKVSIEDIEEEVLLKYHVPCKCSCSLNIEQESITCNRNGNFSCGVCTCKPEWTGVKCDKKITEVSGGGNTNCNGDNNCNPDHGPSNVMINLEGSWERTIEMDVPDMLKIYYNVETAKRNFTIVNTTENFNVKISEIYAECQDPMNCYTIYEAEAANNFCSETSDKNEYVYVKYKFDNSDVLVKYIIPCIPPCSMFVERKSPKCNYKGDFTCGACKCQSGRIGQYCEKVKCEKGRGDVQGDIIQEKCYYNGERSECDTCICNTDRDGYQYFDKENYCADVCQSSSACDDCLYSNIPGECICGTRLNLLKYREERLNQKDSLNRTIWIGCNVTVSNCNVEYVAMVANSGHMYAMVVNNCNIAVTEAVSNVSSLPIVFGLLGVLAAVAAVGGFMMWKHMNAGPPLQLNDPEYTNIDAEDNTGENPLYKPPTSSFKNPTYGKW